jgi:hypothetical protein
MARDGEHPVPKHLHCCPDSLLPACAEQSFCTDSQLQVGMSDVAFRDSGASTGCRHHNDDTPGNSLQHSSHYSVGPVPLTPGEVVWWESGRIEGCEGGTSWTRRYPKEQITDKVKMKEAEVAPANHATAVLASGV